MASVRVYAEFSTVFVHAHGRRLSSVYAIGTFRPRSVPQSCFANDDVLRNVHQTTGQVTRVGGTQRGIGQTLTGTVGGDEVLQNRQALAVRGLDRTRDDLALRVGHQATDTGNLAHLQPVTTGPEDTMRLMVFSSSMLARMASATSLVALVQMSISSWRRSSSAIRPLSYCAWTLACLALVSRQDGGLVHGAVMSEMATVTPERVAQ